MIEQSGPNLSPVAGEIVSVDGQTVQVNILGISGQASIERAVLEGAGIEIRDRDVTYFMAEADLSVGDNATAIDLSGLKPLRRFDVRNNLWTD